jgi:hypothetical protein
MNLLFQALLLTNDNLWLYVFSFAYVEFADKESVHNSTVLSDSLFKGRQIKVRLAFWLSQSC